MPEDGRPRRGVGQLILLEAREIHTPMLLQQTVAEEGAEIAAGTFGNDDYRSLSFLHPFCQPERQWEVAVSCTRLWKDMSI
jgi:hypothetical protein